MPTRIPLRLTRGRGLHTVTGSLTLSGFLDHEEAEFYVDHSLYHTVEDGSLHGHFRDNPESFFSAAPGFCVVPIVDGMTGTAFRVAVTYLADEYVYYYGTELGVAGGAVLTWTRRGTLADTA